MAVLRLDITDFRNLASVRIHPCAHGFNCFHGDNGSGKTGLLEAIYFLGRCRSFRTATADHLIGHSAEKFSLFAHIETRHQQRVPVGMERERQGSMNARIAGESYGSAADLLALTPSLLINSGAFTLLDAGPQFRRKYLDWAAFYLTNDFLPAWRTCERVLKQRNAVLREHKSKKEVEIWNGELIKTTLTLDRLRRETVSQLLPFLQTTLAELIDLPGLELAYYPGWDEEIPYEEVIARGIEKDRSAGYTRAGPHRADFRLIINELPVKDILSRGQQKLFICAMIIAQGAMLQACVNRQPIYLIDDLPSELDLHGRVRLMALLARQNAQVFVTAIEREGLRVSTTDSCQVPVKMFHVEHGGVREEN